MTTMKLTLAAVVAGILIAAPAAQAKTLRCDVKKTTVAASATVRVFASGPATSESERDLYACRRPRGKAIFLFDGALNERWSSVRIAADRYVSVVDRRVAPVDGLIDLNVARVDVVDRKRSSWSTGLNEAPADRDVALLDDGTVALIDRDNPLASRVVLTRFGAFFGSAPIVVDTAPSAALQELAAAGSRLYWLKAGVARTLPAGSMVPVSGAVLATALPQETTMSPRSGSGCGKALGSTMLATPSARMYFVGKRKRNGKKAGEDIVACRLGGAKTTLFRARSGDVYGNPALAGRYALLAHGEQPTGNESSLQNTTIVVRDLVTRKLFATHTNSGFDVLPNVVLATTGRFAYVRGTHVFVVDPGSFVDAGQTSATPDLAASARAFYWLGADNLPHVGG